MMNTLYASASLLVLASLGWAEDLKNSPAGFWDDGLEGENTGLYLNTEGKGDFISLRCYSLVWTYEPTNQLITIHLKEADKDKKDKILEFKYDAEKQTLAGTGTSPSSSSLWRFNRARQGYIDWWLGVKKKNSEKASQTSQPTSASRRD